MNSQTNLAAETPWKFRVDNYAHHVSKKKWIKYRWVSHMLRLVQDAIVKGDARIILNAPPRHGKSEAISHWLPTWYLDLFPNKRVILASYGDSFAADWGLKVRKEFTRNPLTTTVVSNDRKKAQDWHTEEDGGMRSAGISGSLTGLGGDLVIIDDPHKNWEEAKSPTIKKKVIDGFLADIVTRLEPGASIIILQTRWDPEDLCGWILDHDPDKEWTLYKYPAIAEEDDILGREVGEALCPERFTVEVLLKIKKFIRSHKFNGLFQQGPTAPEGNIVKREWIKHWSILPQTFVKWAQSWDLAFGDTGSYVVGQVWGSTGGNFYLVDQIREKMTFLASIKAMKDLTEKWPLAVTKLVENKANGRALIDTLKKKVPGLISVNPQGDKEARLEAVSDLFEAGDVFFPPESVDWVPELINEVCDFPNTKTDDQVDTTSQALSRFSDGTYETDFSLGAGEKSSEKWSDLYG